MSRTLTLLVGAIGVALVACGDDDTGSAAEPTRPASGEAGTPLQTVVIEGARIRES